MPITRHSSRHKHQQRQQVIDFVKQVRAFPKVVAVTSYDRLRGARNRRVGTAIVSVPSGTILVRPRGSKEYRLPGAVAHQFEERESAVVRVLSEQLGVRGVSLEMLFRYHGDARHAVYYIELKRDPELLDARLELLFYIPGTPVRLTHDTRGILRSYETKTGRDPDEILTEK